MEDRGFGGFLKGSSDVERALRLVGELLEAGGHAYHIVVIGGSALNLLGVVARATTDVDILAFAAPDRVGSLRLSRPGVHLPGPLSEATGAVAPSDEELENAASWIRAQDPTAELARVVSKVVEHARSDRERTR